MYPDLSYSCCVLTAATLWPHDFQIAWYSWAAQAIHESHMHTYLDARCVMINAVHEANERDDQSNIRKALQHYTIHRREGGNIAFCEILCSYTERDWEVYKHEVLYASWTCSLEHQFMQLHSIISIVTWHAECGSCVYMYIYFHVY